MKRAIDWFSTNWRSHKLPGKLVMLGALLGLAACPCSFCLSLLSLPTSTRTPMPTAVARATAPGSTATPSATAAQVATVMPAPTDTAWPTGTPTPTVRITPTDTAPPTETPLPTNTPSPRPERTLATVVEVVDGDTIQVSIAGQVFPLRYIGIDAPEPGEPFSAECSQANRELVLGKTVALEKDVSETDRYGRLLRYVWVGNLMVNAELLRLGWAEASAYPPDTKHQEWFRSLYLEAQQAGRGVWALAVEVPTLVQPPPTVGGDVVISFVNYDGDVPRVESDEYAVIENRGANAVDLTGWRLYAGDEGQWFRFPSIVLASGQSCRVYTNELHPESCGLTFSSGRPLWNNKGDCGCLYDSSGALVDTYCYLGHVDPCP